VAVSQSINKVVADDVVGPADPASLKGKTISFVGAFTVSSGSTDVLVTPVVLEAK
jgi:predicted lipoprotein